MRWNISRRFNLEKRKNEDTTARHGWARPEAGSDEPPYEKVDSVRVEEFLSDHNPEKQRREETQCRRVARDATGDNQSKMREPRVVVGVGRGLVHGRRARVGKRCMFWAGFFFRV